MNSLAAVSTNIDPIRVHANDHFFSKPQNISNKEKIVRFAITEEHVKEVKQDHYKTERLKAVEKLLSVEIH